MEQKIDNVKNNNVENKYNNQKYWEFKKKQQNQKQQQFEFNIMIPPILKRDTNQPKDKYV
jgi:hypothetical protein